MILAHGGHILFAISEDDNVVGTCALLRKGKSFELAKMGVRKELQGRGIGTLLLRKAIETARTEGANSIILYTASKLRRALELYRDHGFEISRIGPHPKYKRVDITMSLDLEEKP